MTRRHIDLLRVCSASC
ncbi:MAG: hypothetical protein ACXWZT_12135 [Gaiellaceae bacterium]